MRADGRLVAFLAASLAAGTPLALGAGCRATATPSPSAHPATPTVAVFAAGSGFVSAIATETPNWEPWPTPPGLPEPTGEWMMVDQSPDDRWRADRLEGMSAEVFDPRTGAKSAWRSSGQRVVRMDGTRAYTSTVRWQPDTHDKSFPTILAWTGDGQAAILADLIHDICGHTAVATRIERLDLGTGEQTLVAANRLIAPALSPSGDRLAFLEVETVVVRDLPTRRRMTFALDPLIRDGEQAGRLLWSSDGRRLVAIVATDPCGDGGHETIVGMDVTTGAAARVTGPRPGRLTGLRWLDADTVAVTLQPHRPRGTPASSFGTFMVNVLP